MNPMDDLKIDNAEEQDPIRIFSSLFMDQLNTQDLKGVLESQQQIISRLDYTNKNLVKTNKCSLETYNSFGVKDYQSYVQLLNSMRLDLEFIFKRIKLIKTKLELKHPTEYRDAIKKVQQNKKFENSDEDEDEEDSNMKRKINVIKEEDLDAETPNTSQSNYARASSFLKERSMSSASTSSTSSASAMVVNLFQTAKNRINTSGYKEMVNGLFNTTTINTQTNDEVPAPVLSTFLTNKLENNQQKTENTKVIEDLRPPQNIQEIDKEIENSEDEESFQEIENVENEENTQESEHLEDQEIEKLEDQKNTQEIENLEDHESFQEIENVDDHKTPQKTENSNLPENTQKTENLEENTKS
jgi:hypothetical protein